MDKLFALTEKEKRFKANYENGGRKLLEKPMTYSEFIAIDEAQTKDYTTALEIYHEEVTTNTPGNTVKEFDENGDTVGVVLHGRYSYPIMHNHMYVEFVYVYSGSCTHFIEEQSIPMKEGDVCLLAPNAVHAVSAASDDAVIINIMMSRKLFTLSFLKIIKGDQMLSEFFEHILYNKQVSPYMIFPTGNDEWMRQTVRSVYIERRETDYLYNESVSLYVRQIFIHLIRHYQMMAIVSNPMNNSQENNIIALLGYITVNYNHMTLKKAAQFFGYNEIYLGQLLLKFTGKNYSTLINELQMKNAKRLLEESCLSITEISHEVGCYDASHFNRKFKAAYGLTPNNYRKQKTQLGI